MTGNLTVIAASDQAGTTLERRDAITARGASIRDEHRPHRARREAEE